MSEPCVARRKDGNPCRGLAVVFDPERNSLVCDAHRPGGPGSDKLKLGRRLMYLRAVCNWMKGRYKLI
jgi:hypothetical protein